jgi:hypothetical protein
VSYSLNAALTNAEGTPTLTSDRNDERRLRNDPKNTETR